MELFKIIKKVFDLTRNEIQQVLKDSKAHAKDLVEKEAERTGSAIAKYQTRVDNELKYKVKSYEYHLTEDVTLDVSPADLDVDYIEWSILRHVYTTGVAIKTSFTNDLIFNDPEAGDITVKQRSFFYDKDKKYIRYTTSNPTNPNYGLFIGYHVLLGGALEKAFIYCYNVKYLAISWTDEAIDSIAYLFYDCQKLRYVSFELPTTAKNYQSVFGNCYELSYYIDGIDWGNATNTIGTFYKARNINFKSSLDINLPLTTSCNQMFTECYALNSVGTLHVPVSTNMRQCFKDCVGLITVIQIDMNIATNCQLMFSGCKKLQSIESITHGEDVNVDTQGMFFGCETLLTSPKIAGTLFYPEAMFSGCVKLTSIPIYKVYNDTYEINGGYRDMFKQCNELTEVGGLDGLNGNIWFSDSPLLTRESCLNIFNYAAEVTTSPSITLHSEAYARLTEEDIAIAVNKGWAVAAAVQSA